jgi:hypothetical protein
MPLRGRLKDQQLLSWEGYANADNGPFFFPSQGKNSERQNLFNAIKTHVLASLVTVESAIIRSPWPSTPMPLLKAV